MRPAPHRQVGRRGHPGRLDGDVAGRVADAEDQHALADERLGRAVVVRVQLLAGEGLRARERRLGPARVPVVPVGDDDLAVAPGLRLAAVAGADGHVVPTAAPGLDLGDLGAEGDPVAQAEVVDEVVEVARDLAVVGVVRQVSGIG